MISKTNLQRRAQSVQLLFFSPLGKENNQNGICFSSANQYSFCSVPPDMQGM
jgi:hypothetical protein